MEITKDEFESYESVRASGVTNMFDVRVVSSFSGLNREQIIEIMRNYGALKAKYQEVA